MKAHYQLTRPPRTVKLHVGHVLEKLTVLDRTQAVTAALQRGLGRFLYQRKIFLRV